VSKEEFREALFDTVEELIKYQLSSSARELLQSYFNNSKGDSSLEKAVDAIEKYTQDQLPPPEMRGKKLKACLNRLAYEAERWDAE